MHFRSQNSRHQLAFIMLGLFVMVCILPALTQFAIRIHQYQVQLKLKNEMAETSLHFTINEWNNLERINKHEILIQHKLFDIKSIQKNDNGIIITGHFDIKEDQLQKTANQLDKKSELNKHSLPFFSFLFFELITEFNFYQQVNKEGSFPITNSSLCSSLLRIESPPPKV